MTKDLLVNTQTCTCAVIEPKPTSSHHADPSAQLLPAVQPRPLPVFVLVKINSFIETQTGLEAYWGSVDKSKSQEVGNCCDKTHSHILCVTNGIVVYLEKLQIFVLLFPAKTRII